MTQIAPTLQAFFTDRLARQLQASPRTVASYRDTLKLLLCFAQERTGKAPSSLGWSDLDEALISAFLEHLEVERGNGPRTRNLRLTAIRSLFKYAAVRHPEHAAVIARVLSIPPKRLRSARSRSSPQRRPTPCSQRPTQLDGRVGATGRSSPWRSKPACGSPS